jgi:hypothetical protein
MPSEDRTNVTIPPETKELLDVIAVYIGSPRNRSAAIRFAAERTAEALGITPKKKSKGPKKVP